MLDRRYAEPAQNTRLTITKQPTAEPVTLDEARDYLRAENNEDDLINSLIATSREYVENWCGGLCIREQQWEQRQTGGMEYIQILRLPVKSIDTVTYYAGFDSNGEDVTVREANGRIYHRNGYFKPGRPGDGYKIEFTAGMDSVPASLKTAMLRLMAFLYENREEFAVNASEGSWSVQYGDLPFDLRQLLMRYHTGLGII